MDMIGKRRESLSAVVEAYLLALKLESRSEGTRRYYRYILCRLARDLKDPSVTSVKVEHLHQHLRRLGDSGISSASLTVYCTVVKRFFGWLAEQGKIKDSPLANMHIHAAPWHPTPPFTKEEIQRLLKAATAPIEKVVLLLLLNTGLRVSELTGLEVEDIDLRRNEIKVIGKGNKQRIEALHPGPKAALREYLKVQTDGLWPEGWDRQKVARLLDDIGRRAGVSRVFPHRFRHTFATAFLRETGDALALKYLLGHSSMMMVERYVSYEEAHRALDVHKKHAVA